MKCIRTIPFAGKESRKLYLTFDDGPDPKCTPEVLEILNSLNVQATFFAIANKAKQNRALFSEIISEGHSIGNHSLDHRFINFFKSKESIYDWILKSEMVFQEILGSPTVGFRSPAGIQTPPLHWALNKLNIPLIHWNIRFFDTKFLWSENKAIKRLTAIDSGSIILLHDNQQDSNKTTFLKTLDVFIRRAKEAGYTFNSILRGDVIQ